MNKAERLNSIRFRDLYIIQICSHYDSVVLMQVYLKIVQWKRLENLKPERSESLFYFILCFNQQSCLEYKLVQSLVLFDPSSLIFLTGADRV